MPLARLWLKKCMLDLGLSAHKFTYNSFRSGGCQYGFKPGAQVQDLNFWVAGYGTPNDQIFNI